MGERETHPSSMFEFFRSGLNALLVGNGGGVGDELSSAECYSFAAEGELYPSSHCEYFFYLSNLSIN